MNSVVPNCGVSPLARHVKRLEGATGPVDAVAEELTIMEIRTVEGFSAMAPEWRALLPESDADCPFLTWEWLYTWWQHQAGSRRLLILAIYRRNALVGIAPFAVRPAEPRRLLPFRAVEFLGVGTVGSDYLDLILKQGEEGAACAVIAEFITQWNLMLDLRRVRSGSSAVETLVRELSIRGWKTMVRDDDSCAYVPISGMTWDEYFSGLGASFRAAVRRRRRQAQRDFAVECTHVHREHERSEVLREFVRLHNMRWDKRGGSQALPDESIIRFHEKWSKIALDQGWLRLSLLRFDNTPVAGIYAFCYRGKLYFYLSGFDPEYKNYSPGRICQEESLREAFKEEMNEYDFLHGDEGYKYHWARHARGLGRYHLFPPGGRGTASKWFIEAREGCKVIFGAGRRTRRTGNAESSKGVTRI